jgi:hypothetical protein
MPAILVVTKEAAQMQPDTLEASQFNADSGRILQREDFVMVCHRPRTFARFQKISLISSCVLLRGFQEGITGNFSQGFRNFAEGVGSSWGRGPSPKPESRRPKEVRRSKPEKQPQFRISEFGLLSGFEDSGFGFRPGVAKLFPVMRPNSTFGYG